MKNSYKGHPMEFVFVNIDSEKMKLQIMDKIKNTSGFYSYICKTPNDNVIIIFPRNILSIITEKDFKNHL